MAATTTAKPGGAVLVVGDGLFGAAIAEAVGRNGRKVVRGSRRPNAGTVPLDLAVDAGAWPIPAGVATTHLCAAITSIAECRDRPDAARAVNVEGTAVLAGRLVAAGSRVVFPSTNMVFDGSEPFARHDAVVTPHTVYGRLKREAERRLLDLGDGVCVVRLTKVLGRRVPLFEEWRAALAAGRPIHPFSDMVLAPVSLGHAVRSLIAIGDAAGRGIFHVSANADISYADVARRLAGIMGVDPGLVRPQTVVDAGLSIEHVPRHTTLAVDSAAASLGIVAPDPWQAIDESLAP